MICRVRGRVVGAAGDGERVVVAADGGPGGCDGARRRAGWLRRCAATGWVAAPSCCDGARRRMVAAGWWRRRTARVYTRKREMRKRKVGRVYIITSLSSARDLALGKYFFNLKIVFA
jgi:hypothetical protein